MEVFYTVDDPTTFYSFDTKWDFDSPEWIAEDCAEDYFTRHGGREARWPLTFALYDAPCRKCVRAVVEVELEHQPVFIGRVI